MLWDEIVKLALLGAERSNLTPTMKETLQGYGIDTEKEITEVILESATLQAPLQKAGFQPKKWEGSILEKSPEEILSTCTPQSAKHLGVIISGSYPFALTEFVQAMSDNQKCLPFELLPDLLDKCVKDADLWEQLKPTIGNRGHWLIDLNPDWQKLVAKASPKIWEKGTKEERLTMLKKVREAQPKEGLALLLSTWKEEGLAEKTAFLKCLSIGLSDSDEVFLETCLDFSRKEIREVAASLLNKLPNSLLQKRIWARLEKSIIFNKTDEVEKIEIILPDSKDKALIRDGISPKRKWKKGGQTTGMLYQMVSILPPEKWEKYFQKNPTEIVALFSKSEWAIMLIEGVAIAATEYEAKKWQEAILRFWLANHTNKRWAQLDVRPIFDNLPNDLFNEILIEKLKAVKFLPNEHSPLIQLLQKENYVWEKKLTNLVMTQLKTWIIDNATYSWSGFQYRTMVKQAAYNIQPSMEKELSHFWLGDTHSWGGWDRDIHHFLSVLSFRKDMLEELKK